MKRSNDLKTSALTAFWYLLSIRHVCRKLNFRKLLQNLNETLLKPFSELPCPVSFASESQQLFTDFFCRNFYHFGTACSCCCCLFSLARCGNEIFRDAFANGCHRPPSTTRPQWKSLYWIILQNLRGIKSGNVNADAIRPMLGAAKGLSSAKVSYHSQSQSQSQARRKENRERRMESEQKTFIYILKVDASISPKSISVPHIFGALPTYGTFKVGPRPPLPSCASLCNAKQLQNLSGLTAQQKTRPAKQSRHFVS